MDIAKQKKLEDQGWKVSTTSEFLGLSIEEELFIKLKLSLSNQLREIRLPIKSSSNSKGTSEADTVQSITENGIR